MIQVLALKERYKQACDEERLPIIQFRIMLKTRLKSIPKAKWYRRRKKESAFIGDPLVFTRKLLGDKRADQLECFADDITTYLRNTLSYPVKDKDLGHIEALISPSQQTIDFDLT